MCLRLLFARGNHLVYRDAMLRKIAFSLLFTLPLAFWFLIKMYFLVFSVVWVRWTFPRTQFYGLLNLSWKILIPLSLLTLLLSSVALKLPKLFGV